MSRSRSCTPLPNAQESRGEASIATTTTSPRSGARTSSPRGPCRCRPASWSGASRLPVCAVARNVLRRPPDDQAARYVAGASAPPSSAHDGRLSARGEQAHGPSGVLWPLRWPASWCSQSLELPGDVGLRCLFPCRPSVSGMKQMRAGGEPAENGGAPGAIIPLRNVGVLGPDRRRVCVIDICRRREDGEVRVAEQRTRAVVLSGLVGLGEEDEPGDLSEDRRRHVELRELPSGKRSTPLLVVRACRLVDGIVIPGCEGGEVV